MRSLLIRWGLVPSSETIMLYFEDSRRCLNTINFASLNSVVFWCVNSFLNRSRTLQIGSVTRFIIIYSAMYTIIETASTQPIFLTILIFRRCTNPKKSYFLFDDSKHSPIHLGSLVQPVVPSYPIIERRKCVKTVLTFRKKRRHTI